jgi:hypothetical protein
MRGWIAIPFQTTNHTPAWHSDDSTFRDMVEQLDQVQEAVLPAASTPSRVSTRKHKTSNRRQELDCGKNKRHDLERPSKKRRGYSFYWPRMDVNGVRRSTNLEHGRLLSARVQACCYKCPAYCIYGRTPQPNCFRIGQEDSEILLHDRGPVAHGVGSAAMASSVLVEPMGCLSCNATSLACLARSASISMEDLVGSEQPCLHSQVVRYLKQSTQSCLGSVSRHRVQSRLILRR